MGISCEDTWACCRSIITPQHYSYSKHAQQYSRASSFQKQFFHGEGKVDVIDAPGNRAVGTEIVGVMVWIALQLGQTQRASAALIVRQKESDR